LPEVGPLRPDVVFVPAFVVLAAVVAAFIAYTILGRLLYERRRARDAEERARVENLARRLRDGEVREDLGAELEDVLAGVGRANKVALVEAIGELEEPARSAYLARVTRHEGWEALSKRALRSPFKWRRVEAIGILGGLDPEEVVPVLSQCLEDRDDDVVYAAARALAKRPDLRAAGVLLDFFGRGRVDPKRLMTMLEEFPVPTYELLWPRLEDPDPETRVRAATLLEVSEEPETVPRLIVAAADPDPDVRSAAIRSLANIWDPRGGEVLPEAFGDEAWFVRAAAARLAGSLGISGHAGRLVGLLGDGNWWVRQSAKQALLALCPEVERDLERYLAVDDRFVRNMVAEVLDASGAVQRRAEELEENPGSGPARRFFGRLIVAEGRGSVEGLARRAAPGAQAALRELLDAGAARAS
jgi:HEAT repeat protein